MVIRFSQLPIGAFFREGLIHSPRQNGKEPYRKITTGSAVDSNDPPVTYYASNFGDVVQVYPESSDARRKPKDIDE